MILILSEELYKARLNWKPPSLEIMVLQSSGSMVNGVGDKITIPSAEAEGEPLTFKEVTKLKVLGSVLDHIGSTLTSVENRLAIATKMAFKDMQKCTSLGNWGLEMQKWQKEIQPIAMHGCRSWEVTAVIIQRLRRWELVHLRRVLCMRRKITNGVVEAPWDYNARTGRRIHKLFHDTG